MASFDPQPLRAQFPALSLTVDGRPAVFLDGPAGTQVPERVVEAVSRYYRESNANRGGAFVTSERSDAMLDEAHVAMADFLGAASPDEIKFGQNMTSLTFALGRSIGRTLRPGDEVLLTWLDHDANVTPWRLMAEDAGATVRMVDIDPADCTLDLAGLRTALSERTRLVAVGYASNAVGTINPVAEIVRLAHEAGALTFVDAVHYGPHGPIDVQALGTDFLACSVYKFFGPHLGVLYGRAELLDSLPAYKVRPASDRWETGTQSHETIAGALAALEYIAEVGERFGAPFVPEAGGAVGRRLLLRTAMRAIAAYERGLGERLLAGLAAVPGMHVVGIADTTRSAERVPTVSITAEGWSPRELAAALGRGGIFAWDGDFYASGLMERLGLAETGGVVRLGLVHYNTAAEVDRLLETLAELARSPVASRT
ncbi:MAG TPA: cysteine desulfurase-like protein [Candidatus Limnocylindrales bacterium]|nr:cysteine desulfurase-like protein [Candidatus Limnocylindrales bacterium]